MQSLDFNDFLNTVRHFSYEDVVQTAKLKEKELEKVKSVADKKEAALLLVKIREFLHSLKKNKAGKR